MSAPADHTQIEVKVRMQFCELEASTGIRETRSARSLTYSCRSQLVILVAAALPP